MGRYWQRPLGSKLIILLSAAFLVEMLAPWTRVCVATGTVAERKCGWTTGYEGSDFGLYAALFALAILVWELLPILIPRLSMRGWPTAIVTAILGVGLGLCTLVKVIEDNEFQTGWAWVGLAIALATMLVALLRVRYRWGIRGRDRPPPAVVPAAGRRAVAREATAPSAGMPAAARGHADGRSYPWRTTYGGDQVSTWSVLRSSSEPRSPVGLVKQPAQTQVRRTISHSPPSKH